VENRGISVLENHEIQPKNGLGRYHMASLCLNFINKKAVSNSQLKIKYERLKIHDQLLYKRAK